MWMLTAELQLLHPSGKSSQLNMCFRPFFTLLKSNLPHKRLGGVQQQTEPNLAATFTKHTCMAEFLPVIVAEPVYLIQLGNVCYIIV